MKKLICICMILFLFGCATTQDRAQFYEAQQKYYQDQSKTPLFEMKAVEGKSIENLASLVVYTPSPKEAFKQFSEAHPGWETANTLLRVGGQIAGIYFVVDGVKSIFGNFSTLANAPKSVTTTTTNYNNTVSGQSTGYLLGPTNIGSVKGMGNTVGGGIFQTADPLVVEQPAPVIVGP